MTKTYEVEIKKLENAEVEIKGEITAEAFMGEKDHVLMEIGEDMEIQGFRKGKAPKDVIEKNIPKIVLLEEMAQHAIMHIYPEILTENKIDAIGQPGVQITKIAENSPLGFVIKTATMPVVTLPDYIKIAKTQSKEIKVEVTEEEFQNTIKELRKMRAPHVHAEGEEHKEGEVHEVKEEDLPVFDDAFVQGLGPFKDVADFNVKMRENMQKEKEHKEREKNRLAIMEKVLEGTKTEIPKILIDAELDKMLYRMKADISGMGLAYEDYLKHLGKSEEAIRNEFVADAEKRVKMELILHEVAMKEKLVPKEEDVNAEVDKIMSEYKDADKDRAREYVTMVLTNEMVFKFLEDQGK